MTPPLILHIPHASRLIPAEDRVAMVPDDATLAHELLRMTDAWTDKLVEVVTVPATRIVFPVSRLVVDPERFPEDAEEPMAEKGMGAVYTRLSTGEPLRHPDAAERARLMDRYYWPHHRRLDEAVDAALAEHGRALIVDVHSFSSVPLPHEPDQDPQRPELCIGCDAFHSPFRDDQEAVQIGMEAGFDTVAINRPFAGSLVPAKHWQRTRDVKSVMIEVRRDLCMDEETGKQWRNFGAVAAGTAWVIEALVRGCTDWASNPVVRGGGAIRLRPPPQGNRRRHPSPSRHSKQEPERLA
jgi:N-formylglutamate amidohydrolase